MRAVVQRVSRASVEVDGKVIGSIDHGLLVLLAISHDDDRATAHRLAGKIAALRVFEDDQGKMNRALAEVQGAVLCISQFTLLADIRRGNRPSFSAAASPDAASNLYEYFCEVIRGEGLKCETGVFGADMQVALVNDGPVTLVIDSADLERPRG